MVFGPGVTVDDGALIRSFSHLEGASVGRGAKVGPYARLRPGARLEADVHVGNFVEVKEARLGAGAKANHLSYIGDASVGEGTNVGAGTITCNYDGTHKHRTEIGSRAFIGSNSSLVAPVKIGDGAYVGSGLGDHRRRAGGFARARPRPAGDQGGVGGAAAQSCGGCPQMTRPPWRGLAASAKMIEDDAVSREFLTVFSCFSGTRGGVSQRARGQGGGFVRRKPAARTAGTDRV